MMGGVDDESEFDSQEHDKALPMRKQRILGGSLISIVVIGIGVAIFRYGAHQIRDAWQSPNWPTAQGTITRSSVGLNSGGSRRTWDFHRASIAYTFTVAGRTYQGERVRYSQSIRNQSNAAAGILFKYPLGKGVIVFYRPSDPSNCVLEPGGDIVLYLIPGAGLCLIGLGIYILFRLIWPGAKRAEKDTIEE